MRKFDTTKVVDLIDAVSRNFDTWEDNSSFPNNYIYGLESERLLRYEREMVAEFDRSLITTECDKDYIGKPNVTILPNGVDESLLSFQSQNPIDLPSETITFLGNMSYPPNVDAVSFFTNEIYPSIRRQRPDVPFYIVGKSPTEEIHNLESQPGVHVTGYVERPEEYLASSAVVVAPMRMGTGIQNKILESMALSLPVVTTPQGSDGIDGADGKHYIVRDSPRSFAKAVVDLLERPGYRSQIGKNAYELVRSQYTWDAVEETLIDSIETLEL